MAWLKSKHTWSGQMQCHELYIRIGLDPKKHLPDEGVSPINIDGVVVYTLSKRLLRLRKQVAQDKAASEGRKLRRRPMKRTFAICPVCSRHIEAGHLFQHRKAAH